MLQWAHDNGCEWDETICSVAAECGHLAVLQWAREHDCPWSQETTKWAARGGHLEVLKYAHENGCPCDETTCAGAAMVGRCTLTLSKPVYTAPLVPLLETQYDEQLSNYGYNLTYATTLWEDTCTCCSGCGSTGARGMRPPLRVPQLAGTRRQGLTLFHFLEQPEPFLSL